MIRAVIDTNVIISGLMKPESNPGEILKKLPGSDIFPVVSMSMLEEYVRVMNRKKFGFSKDEIRTLILLLGRAAFDGGKPADDLKVIPPDDAIFVSAAITGGADYLITGNTKHFPQKKYGKCRVVTPAAFLEILKK